MTRPLLKEVNKLVREPKLEPFIQWLESSWGTYYYNWFRFTDKISPVTYLVYDKFGKFLWEEKILCSFEIDEEDREYLRKGYPDIDKILGILCRKDEDIYWKFMTKPPYRVYRIEDPDPLMKEFIVKLIKDRCIKTEEYIVIVKDLEVKLIAYPPELVYLVDINEETLSKIKKCNKLLEEYKDVVFKKENWGTYELRIFLC